MLWQSELELCAESALGTGASGPWRTPADGTEAAAAQGCCCPSVQLLRTDAAAVQGCCSCSARLLHCCARMQPRTLTMDPSSNLDSV